MNKFLTLFKKEIKELVTWQTVLSILAGVLIFVWLGNIMSDVTKETTSSLSMLAVADQDNSSLSQQVIDLLEEAQYEIISLSGTDEQALLKQAKENSLNSYLEIPKGFEDDIKNGIAAQVKAVSKLESLSLMSSAQGNSASSASRIINDGISSLLISQNISGADVAFLKNPVVCEEVTVVADKSASVSSAAISQFSMQQTLFVPIIVFLLITYATQMTVSTIASEKGDKTLETLLSAPVSRLAVLSSKMCAAGILSLLMAAVYMVGFSRYMSGMTGNVGESEAQSFISETLQTLGLNLDILDFLLIGVQLFLTILIALALSVVLGALSKDIKSAQGLVAPIMFLAMIPYFVTLFMDVNQLPTVFQVLISLIPFTHTFTASSNLIFGNTTAFFGGMIYQFVLLCIVMFFAVKVFSTDKIFTMSLDLSKKKNKKKQSV